MLNAVTAGKQLTVYLNRVNIRKVTHGECLPPQNSEWTMPNYWRTIDEPCLAGVPEPGRAWPAAGDWAAPQPEQVHRETGASSFWMSLRASDTLDRQGRSSVGPIRQLAVLFWLLRILDQVSDTFILLDWISFPYRNRNKDSKQEPPANLQIATFQPVLKRKKVSENILDKEFSINLNPFSQQNAFSFLKFIKLSLCQEKCLFLK